MSDSYYVGDFRNDALNGQSRGWVVGNFQDFPLDPPRNPRDVEIKYWEYKAGEVVKQYLKVSTTIECTFILKGKTKCLVGDEEVELKQGDYIVIPPGTPNNTVAEILEDVAALTIKAPSDPNSKKIVNSKQ